MTDRRGNAKKRVALLVASLSSFLTSFVTAAIDVALPSIGRDLAVDTVLLGSVTTSYLLAATMSLVPFGKVADLVGRKRIFTSGVLAFVLSSLLATVAPSGEVLVGFRVVQGWGGAMIAVTIVAILTSIFPAEERSRALGVSTAVTYVGLSAGGCSDSAAGLPKHLPDQRASGPGCGRAGGVEARGRMARGRTRRLRLRAIRFC